MLPNNPGLDFFEFRTVNLNENAAPGTYQMVVVFATEKNLIPHGTVRKVDSITKTRLSQQVQRPGDGCVSNGRILLFGFLIKLVCRQMLPRVKQNHSDNLPLVCPPQILSLNIRL
jgi:hypothetical protein